LLRDQGGTALVEATILFPIMVMIFLTLVLLALYLPTRAALQTATQYAAVAMAAESGDTWLSFDDDAMQYSWADSRGQLPNVYQSVFRAFGNGGSGLASKATNIVTNMEGKGFFHPPGELTVEYTVLNYVVYKELRVTATQAIAAPIDLSFVGLPTEIPITVTSSAVVVNGDEFVRNMDVARDFATFMAEKLKLDKAFDSIKTLAGKFNAFFGI